MRAYILGVALLGAACSPQYIETRLQPGERAPTNEARFADSPAMLHRAFQASCQGPNDIYATIGKDMARCQTVPPPDIAAQLLLRYDGALEVPYIIVERQSRKDDDGYIESFGYFASVPLKTGREQRVYIRSARLERTFDLLFRTFGGEPL